MGPVERKLHDALEHMDKHGWTPYAANAYMIHPGCSGCILNHLGAIYSDGDVHDAAVKLLLEVTVMKNKIQLGQWNDEQQSVHPVRNAFNKSIALANERGL